MSRLPHCLVHAFLSGLAATALACGPAKEASGTGGTQRLASATVLTDRILWDLGEPTRERVVAVSTMADDPRYSDAADLWPAAIPRVGGQAESLIARRPDVVFLASFSAQETRAMLEQAEVKVVVLDAFRGFQDYREHVETVAQAVGAVPAGAKVIQDFDDRLARLRAPEGGERPTVVSWSDGHVPARATTFHDIATAAGLTNLPAREGLEGHVRVSVETMVTWDPDMVVLACAPGPKGCAKATAAFAGTEGLGALRAVKQGGVVAIDAAILSSVGPGMLDAVETLRHRGPADG